MLDALLESALDAIITIDTSGTMQTINPATEKLFGYTSDDLIGHNVSMLMAEPHRSSHDRYIANYLRTSEKKIIGIGRDVEAQKSDGSVFPMHLAVSEFTHEGKRYFTGLIHDTSKREAAEASVRDSEARLGLILEASSDGWWDRNLDTGEELWSHGIFNLFGFQPGEVLPSAALKEKFIHPDDAEIRNTAIEDHLVHGQPYKAEFRFRRTDGKYVWVRTSGMALRDASGHPYRMIGTLTDITAEKIRESQYQQAARLESVGQLTGGIAHDFNNILTIISGNLELMGMRALEPELKELMEEALTATDKGAQLTERLLSFARRGQLEPTVLNLNETILSLTELLKRTLGGQIQLSTAIAPDLWATKVDAGQFENAIINLLINARDAMPDGGRVIVETRNLVADNELFDGTDLAPGKYVQITVTDSGVGMSADVLERAFEPFFTTKESGKGSGLGLSMIYGFAKQSGGHTAIYSEEGHGTTVNLYLPAHDRDQAEEVTPAAIDPTPHGKGERILVVEDDPGVRELTLKRLTNLGYQVVSANCAEDALTILRRDHDLSLVFTDIVMPGGKSGIELAEEIHASNPEMRILLTSGYAEELMRPETLEKHDLRVLRKPYRTVDLALAIHTALQG